MSQAGAGRSQLRRKTGQNPAARSSFQPGSSDHAAPTQRACGRSMLGGCGASVAGSAPEGGVAFGRLCPGAGVSMRLVSGLSPGPADGRVEQAASAATAIPRISAEASGLAHRKALVMWVILLEALAALVLIVFIVWWTMFSGRRKGERHDGSSGDGG
jgi:hypothetical protein